MDDEEDECILCEDEDDSILVFQTTKKISKTIESRESQCSKSRIPLLAYEQSIMLKTFKSNALFIIGRGLGMERLFLNHLYLYNNSKLTIFVINLRHEDEVCLVLNNVFNVSRHFFLKRLIELNVKVLPKVITANVQPKDRILIYKTGGVQFITLRILTVDLLTKRVPIENVAGILYFLRLLTRFQESFILNVFCERRKNGFIKAFMDEPTKIKDLFGNNNLSCLIEKLCNIQNVFFVSKDSSDFKKSFNAKPLKLTKIRFDLSENEKVVRKNLFSLITTCARELLQCTGYGDEKNLNLNEDSFDPDALNETALEIFLRERSLLLTERQQRILNDLQTLRILLQRAEDLDPFSAWYYAMKIRNEKKILQNNSGWIFTSAASKIFNSIDALCFGKAFSNGSFAVKTPAKWTSFITALNNIAHDVMDLKVLDSPSSVLVLASNERTCQKLIDLTKFGANRLLWMLSKLAHDWRSNRFCESNLLSNCNEEPEIVPLWNLAYVVFYDEQMMKNDQTDLLKVAQDEQKKTARETNRRGPKRLLKKQNNESINLESKKVKKSGVIDDNVSNLFQMIESRLNRLAGSPPNSDNLLPNSNEQSFFMKSSEIFDRFKSCESFNYENTINFNLKERNNAFFGIQQHGSLLELLPDENYVSSSCNSLNQLNTTLLFLTLDNRHNLLNCLEDLKPSHIVLYDADVSSMRIIEAYNAHNSKQLSVYQLTSLKDEISVSNENNSTEDLRVLAYEKEEKKSFETLLSELEALKLEKSNQMNDRANNLSKEVKEDLSTIKDKVLKTPLKSDRKSRLLMTPILIASLNKNKQKSSQLASGNRASRLLIKKSMLRCQTKNNSLLTAKRRSFMGLGVPSKIVVDMREFNSELPTVLYKRGLHLSAVTLEVGDYVLTQKICVERKGLDDLAQSLNSGRIFKQIEEMFLHYPRVVLLIESRDKFCKKRVNFGSFQGNLWRQSREIRLLLTTLIRKNPRLKLLWSVSPTQSAELFQDLKEGRSDPNPDSAIAIRSGDWIAEVNNKCELNDSSIGVRFEDGYLIKREIESKNLFEEKKDTTAKCIKLEFKTEKIAKNCKPKSKKEVKKLNHVLKRQLQRLPYLTCQELDIIMKTMDDMLIEKNLEKIENSTVKKTLLNKKMATLHDLINLPTIELEKFLENENVTKLNDLHRFFTSDYRSGI